MILNLCWFLLLFYFLFSLTSMELTLNNHPIGAGAQKNLQPLNVRLFSRIPYALGSNLRMFLITLSYSYRILP
jgi:hypothetical protein